MLRISLMLACLLIVGAASAQESAGPPSWDRLGISIGSITSTIDANFRLGLKGSALAVDLEETLGMEGASTVFHTSIFYRFTQNRRHRFDLSWHAFRLDGRRELQRDVTFGGKTFSFGTIVDSSFDLDVYRFSYGYSFLQDDRVDMGITTGIFIAPMDFSISTQSGRAITESASYTAPMPTLGLYSEFLLTPAIRLRQGIDLFYIEYRNFSGAISDFTLAMEYTPWKHVALGVGVDLFSLDLSTDAESDEWPGFDRASAVSLDIKSISLYFKVTF